MTLQFIKQNKILFFLIIIQPILDLLTPLTMDLPLSIGALFRTILMLGLFFYIVNTFFKNNKTYFIAYAGSFLAVAIMFVINFTSKANFVFVTEFNFLLKVSYFLVITYFILSLFQKKPWGNKLIIKATMIASCLIGFSFWLAIFTETSISSYVNANSGYSGWFFAANELSIIVLILLGIIVSTLTFTNDLLAWLSFLLIISMIPMIGTKTAFLGGLIIVLGHTVLLLWKTRMRIWKHPSVTAYLLVIVLFFTLLPFTPATSDSRPNSMQPQEQRQPVVIPTDTSAIYMHPKVVNVLSSRPIYLDSIKADFQDAELPRQLFGLGYAGDYEKQPKIIEMDFFDLFFSFGYIGSVLLLLPVFMIIWHTVKRPSNSMTAKGNLLLILLLCGGISFLAGHVLFAPSVMSYIALLFLALGGVYEFEG
ncbi:O-antigen ligase family protein [Virgibacillus halodenitrificans]|uniref:O-antigen ligase family protein n=1 Tax=Virgibacillus halodenitrificans TaxID=1482 RepID=A0ABR7VHH0_VIRHA|nr:O-antigen ligase family protein [Virgibacillus halodenitrificans]MBD1221395.1 O-antigen ligase family protein [Virgibacillus halodenitrificans]